MTVNEIINCNLVWHNAVDNIFPSPEMHFLSKEVMILTDNNKVSTGFYNYILKTWYEKTFDEVKVIKWCELLK